MKMSLVCEEMILPVFHLSVKMRVINAKSLFRENVPRTG